MQKKPVSAETIESLYDNMGKTINDFFPKLHHCAIASRSLKSKKEQIPLCFEMNKLLDIYGELLYLIIQIATAFRATFKASSPVEKRLNLTQLVVWSFELYNEFFTERNGKKSQWDWLRNHLKKEDTEDITKYIELIEQAIIVFDKEYSFYKLRHKRNISAHFKFPIRDLYHYVISLNEEDEAQLVCKTLAIIQPLIGILSKLQLFNIALLFGNAKEYDLERLYNIQYDFPADNQILEQLECSIPKHAKIYDRLMFMYNSIDISNNELKKLIGCPAIKSIEEKIHYADLSIFVIHLQLSLMTALKAYWTSEFDIEKKFHLLRINSILFEGYKKLYKDNAKGGVSMWKKCVYDVIMSGTDSSSKVKANMVEYKLQAYKQEMHFINNPLRDYFFHVCNDETGESNVPALLSLLSIMNPLEILGRALQFVYLFNDIIELSTKTIEEINKSPKMI